MNVSILQKYLSIYENTYLYSYSLSQEAPLFKSEALIPHVRIRMIQLLNKYNSAIRKNKGIMHTVDRVGIKR